MNKTKRIILIVAILAIAIFLLFIGIYYFQQKSPQYQAQKYISEMEKKYREDTYGGDTPEQTLQMFIDALKKGDTDLASRYFEIEKQDKWRGDLKVGKENGSLNLLLGILEKPKIGKEIFEGNYLYSISSKNDGVADFSISLVKNKITNKWKIESL